MGKTSHHRTVADLEPRTDPAPLPPAASTKAVMCQRLQTQAGRALYKLRQQTVEPVFGIIKSVLGFRQFRLRGQAKVALEWTLVCLAYNLKRLHRLGAGAATGRGELKRRGGPLKRPNFQPRNPVATASTVPPTEAPQFWRAPPPSSRLFPPPSTPPFELSAKGCYDEAAYLRQLAQRQSPNAVNSSAMFPRPKNPLPDLLRC